MKKIIFLISLICLVGLMGIAGAYDINDVYPTYNGRNIPLANGQPMVLHNNPDARVPSYLELTKALKQDATNFNVYHIKTYKCTDFAQDLHNGLEAAGIKTAVVMVGFKDKTSHELNLVVTRDRGAIYIDNCIPKEGSRGMDARATLKSGSAYKISDMFSGKSIKSKSIVKMWQITW